MYSEILKELMEEKKKEKIIIMFIQADVKCKVLRACLCKHWNGNKRSDVLCQTASGLEKWFTPFIDCLPNEDRWKKKEGKKEGLGTCLDL